MPGPYDPADIRLFVSPSGDEGSFVELLEMTSQEANRGSESTIRTPTFGRATPHVRAGEKTSGYSLSGLLDWDDDGQQILRDAYGDRSTIALRRLFPDTHRTTETCVVTEAPDSAERDGDWVENAFTLEGLGDEVKDTGDDNDPVGP